MRKSSYYDPIRVTHTYRVGAWTIDVGVTEHGDWIAEYTSTAAPRPQRHYFDTEEEAIAEAEAFGRV